MCRWRSHEAHQWLWDAKMVSWWLVWEDLEWPSPHLEEKWVQRARCFQQQGANTVVIFGFHFRWDYLAILDRVLSILARIAEICHDHGLRVVDHHSATLVHRARNQEDRWRIRTVNRHHVPYYPDTWDTVEFQGSGRATGGRSPRRTARRCTTMATTANCSCPNHPDYQQAYLNFVGMHLERVPFDAVMSDDLHFLPDLYTCGCQFCRERFSRGRAGTAPCR